MFHGVADCEARHCSPLQGLQLAGFKLLEQRIAAQQLQTRGDDDGLGGGHGGGSAGAMDPETTSDWARGGGSPADTVIQSARCPAPSANQAAQGVPRRGERLFAGATLGEGEALGVRLSTCALLPLLPVPLLPVTRLPVPLPPKPTKPLQVASSSRV